MNEVDLRDSKEFWPKSLEELTTYIDGLIKQPQDYGTCVYVASLSAVAAFNYVCNELGLTGFQASCADLDIIRRTRSLEGPFRIVDYSSLLYPQYMNSERVPGYAEALQTDDIKKWLKEEAAKRLAEFESSPTGSYSDDDGVLHTYPTAHPSVVEHWRMLASL